MLNKHRVKHSSERKPVSFSAAQKTVIFIVPLALLTLLMPLTVFAANAANAANNLEKASLDNAAVSALGRLEPKHGIMRIAAPSTPQSTSGSVLTQLLVNEGDDVTEGQLLAIIDTASVMEAMVKEIEAELVLSKRQAQSAHSLAEEACVRAGVARREALRRADLLKKGLTAQEVADAAQGDAEAREAACIAKRNEATAAEANIEVAAARVLRHRAQLARSYIRAPVAGRILDILTRPGELVKQAGILELGMVDQMYAIAEVYETDVRRLRIGQKARITSDALAQPLTGVVELIRLKIQKQDEIGTDPAARKDARIVEVEIPLDDSTPAAALTNLQIDIVIGP
jgi:HlyD family secretion protein